MKSCIVPLNLTEVTVIARIAELVCVRLTLIS